MSKRQESDLLGLQALARTDTGSIVPAGSGGGVLTKAEQRIVSEARKQRLIMRYQTTKTAAGMHHISEMHAAGSDEFYNTMVHHEAVNALAQDSAMQGYIVEYNKRDAQQVARHLTAAVEIGARGIAEVIAESCVPPEEPQPGFWSRLFGGE